MLHGHRATGGGLAQRGLADAKALGGFGGVKQAVGERGLRDLFAHDAPKPAKKRLEGWTSEKPSHKDVEGPRDGAPNIKKLPRR